MSATCHNDDGQPVTLLPRELRLVVERILLQTSISAGMVPAVRDVILYSAAAKLGGLPALRADFALLSDANSGAIAVEDLAPGRIAIQGAGQHAWTILPLALDLLTEMVSTGGSGMLTISGASRTEEFATACAMGGRLGLSIFLVTQGACTGPAAAGLSQQPAAEVTLLAAPGGTEDAMLAHALRDGITAAPALWWDLHHLSNTSLSADTPESRRHAGPVIVLEDGRIVGRSDHDDDTDISMLASSEKAS
jgi:hypothetical protein